MPDGIGDGVWGTAPNGVAVAPGTLFLSHALNAVDSKGRVSVPAGFRALIEKRALAHGLDPDNQLMIGEHRGGHCLTALDAVATAEIDAAIAESVADLPAAERYGAIEEKRIDAFGSVEPVRFDGAGRMVLTPMLRALGGISDMAFFLGAGSTFQIWDPRVALEHMPAGSRARRPLEFLMNERRSPS